MDFKKQVEWLFNRYVSENPDLFNDEKDLLKKVEGFVKAGVESEEFVVIRDGKVESSSAGVEHIDMDVVPEMGPEEAFEFYIHLQDLGAQNLADEVKEEFASDWSEWND